MDDKWGKDMKAAKGWKHSITYRGRERKREIIAVRFQLLLLVVEKIKYTE